MFGKYERIAINGTTVTQLSAVANIPPGTIRAQLQADTANIHYTMDGASNPSSTVGMRLIAGLAPEWFEIKDLVRMRMISAGSASGLNIHYYVPDIMQ